MKDENVHLTVNLGLTLTLWAVLLALIWTVVHVPVIGRIGLSAFSLLLAGFIGHRHIPKVTGPLVERMHGKKRSPNQQIHGTAYRRP